MSWVYWGGPGGGGGGGCGLYCCEASEARRLSAAMLWAPLQSDASFALTSAPTQVTPPPPAPPPAPPPPPLPVPVVVPGEPWPQFRAEPIPAWPPPTDEPGGEPRDADTWTPPANRRKWWTMSVPRAAGSDRSANYNYTKISTISDIVEHLSSIYQSRNSNVK